MKAIKFMIRSDGDFGYNVLFTTIVHDNRQVLIQHMIDNLREFHRSFFTSRESVKKINDSIGKFLNAYDDPSKVDYYDKHFESLWFVREKDNFVFSISLDNGNQQMDVCEMEEIAVVKIKGGYKILAYE